MSRQSQEWLDTMIKIGYTDPKYGRGDAWHRRQSNNNSYPDAVPYADAFELIAGWAPVRVSPMWHNTDGDTEHDYRPLRYFGGAQPVALIHSRTHDLLGIHTESYALHGYKERLFDGLSSIFDGSYDSDLKIGTCGLLDGYRKAWVQLELPEAVETAGGNIRPFVTAASSLDGSLATGYFKGAVRVECDNLLAEAISTATHSIKFRNTINSGFKIASAREALDVVFAVAEDFRAKIDELLTITVTEAQWQRFKDNYVPVPEEDGRGKTLAESRRLALDDLWYNDPMVAPWSGTAWGVTQAVNTYAEHHAIVQKISRYERSMINFLKGDTANREAKVMAALTAAL